MAQATSPHLDGTSTIALVKPSSSATEEGISYQAITQTMQSQWRQPTATALICLLYTSWWGCTRNKCLKILILRSTWLEKLVTQSTSVRSKRRRWHRRGIIRGWKLIECLETLTSWWRLTKIIAQDMLSWGSLRQIPLSMLLFRSISQQTFSQILKRQLAWRLIQYHSCRKCAVILSGLSIKSWSWNSNWINKTFNIAWL